MARIDIPGLVSGEYVDEARFATRFKPFREWHPARDMEAEIADIVIAARPDRVLEVGCGMGHFAQRLHERANGFEFSYEAIDQSSRMVDVTRARGFTASVGDAQALAYPDASFDVVVANWMLYHLPRLDDGIAEFARVLRPGGMLVAATMGLNMHAELWDTVDAGDATPELSFHADNGEELLAPHFASVERVDLSGETVFPDRNAVVEYVRSTLTRGHLAAQIPQFDGSLTARTTNAVFIARR